MSWFFCFDLLLFSFKSDIIIVINLLFYLKVKYMPYNINHYIPKFILKNFCENDSKNINVLDMLNFSVEEQNISNAFSKLNFYDISNSDDPKELEKKFNEKLENKVAPIIKRIMESNQDFKICRWELELIKKYIAIQRYRNPANQYYYTNNYSGFKFSNYSKNDFEDDTDFWKREMLYILDNDWNTIITQEEFPGVRAICQEINSEYLSFFRTDDEFVISDLNCFTERIRIKIPIEERQSYNKFAKEYLIKNKLLKKDQLENFVFKDEVEFDNYTCIILSPKLIIISVNPFWKWRYLETNFDNFLSKQIMSTILSNPKNFSLPSSKYVNFDKMKDDADIVKFKDKNDEYIYNILNLTSEETLHVMMLNLNEASLFLGYKSKDYIIKYIREYNSLSYLGINNVKNNFNGYIQLIENLSIKKLLVKE